MGEFFPTLGRAVGTLSATMWRAARCVGRGLRRLGRALLYILPVLFVIHIAATVITGLMLRGELSRMREAGEPLAVREIAPLVPPGEPNAADRYQQAFDALRISGDDEEKLFGEGEISDAERMALGAQVVSANGDYYRLLEEASRTRACAFPVDWDAGSAMIFPHLAKMRQAARMLGLRAEALAARREIDDAVASCAAALRMAEHAKMEPTLIGQLVGYAIQGYAVSALEAALSGGAPAPAAARQMFDQLAAIDQRAPFARAMLGERTLTIWLFDFIRGGRARGSDAELLGWEVTALDLYRTVGRPLLNLDELTSLRMWRQYIRVTQLPWPRSREQSDAADAAIEHLPAYRSILTRMVFPVFGRAACARDKATAKLGTAQVALALKVYRTAHGRYPDSLADFEPASWKLPADPFGGKPYRYRREGKGFLVWSIGPDMDDDEGKPEDTRAPTPEAREDYDIPFRCAQ